MKKNRKIQKEFISPGIHNRYYIARGNIVKALRESTRYAKGKIIDIGCGLKPYKEIFLANKNVTEYIGVDYPPANETHYKGETDADIFCDCLHTPFNTETFDTGRFCQIFSVN